MRFDVLGPLQVSRDGQPVPISSRRQLAILANLLLAGGATVSSERLIEAVWGDDLPANPTNTLQHGIAQLRKMLEPGRTRNQPPQVVVSDGSGYRLAIDGHALDAADFEDAVDEARSQLERGTADAATQTIQEGLDLWRGDAYADFVYEDFARSERERLGELRVAARELAVDARLVATGPESVISDLEGLIVDYPFREGLWARLMTALYQAGRQAEALRVFQVAKRSLGEELGIDPSPELQDLEQQILLQSPSLSRGRTTPAPSNLPVSAGTLIGRDAALERLSGLLSSARLVTLTGPGGSGKTSLAIAAARQSADMFEHGVWLVRLDDLTDPSLLEATIAAVLGMPEDPNRTVLETLSDFIGNRALLLVVDNCEHVVDAVATTLDRLLASCAGLVVLATSQEPLGLAPEHRMPVHPLPTPGAGDSPFVELGVAPAVALFIERATAVDPDLDRSDSSMAAIANIVNALDGMPLAIELAAARCDVLTPTEIAQRLGDRFGVLDSGVRNAPERQRSLRSAVEWSYNLLGQDEQRFFDHVGVFPGTFTVDDAASVAGVPSEESLDMVGRLVRRSLLSRDPAAGESSRYRMLETLSQFAVERLESGGVLDAVKQRHAEHFSRRATALDASLATHDQTAAFATLVADEDNFRAAMGFSLHEGRLEDGVTIAARLGRFWDWRGSLAEANMWVQRLVAAAAASSAAGPQLGLLLSWASFYSSELGNIDRAKSLTAEACAIAIERGDQFALAVAKTGDALYARVQGAPELALEIDAEIRAIAEEQNEAWIVAWSHNHDALAHIATGDTEAAQSAALASLDGFESLGDRRATGWALTALAEVAHERGDSTAAEELACRAATVSEEVGDGRNAAWALQIAAAAIRTMGLEERAKQLEADAASLLEARGMPFSPRRRPTR